MKHINKDIAVMGWIDCIEYGDFDTVITRKVGQDGKAFYYECTIDEFVDVDEGEEIVYTYAMYVNSNACLDDHDIINRF